MGGQGTEGPEGPVRFWKATDAENHAQRQAQEESLRAASPSGSCEGHQRELEKWWITMATPETTLIARKICHQRSSPTAMDRGQRSITPPDKRKAERTTEAIQKASQRCRRHGRHYRTRHLRQVDRCQVRTGPVPESMLSSTAHRDDRHQHRRLHARPCHSYGRNHQVKSLHDQDRPQSRSPVLPHKSSFQ